MITIHIGDARREWKSLDDVQESWIVQQITDRHHAGQPVCVFVRIAVSGIDVGMATGQCEQRYSPGPPRHLNQDERQILELWRQRVGSNGQVDPGGVNAFFKQLRQFL